MPYQSKKSYITNEKNCDTISLNPVFVVKAEASI